MQKAHIDEIKAGTGSKKIRIFDINFMLTKLIGGIMKYFQKSNCAFLLKLSVFILIVSVTVCESQGINGSTSKWFKSGSYPQEYEMGGDPFSNMPEHAAYVKSIGDSLHGFGTWMTKIEPGAFLNHRVKLTVYLKSKNVDNWSSMWMRVDSKTKGSISFDNMRDRAIKGTMDWKKYAIVLDVPDSSTGVFYGVLLLGKGEVHAKDLKLEIVDKTVKSTDMNYWMKELYTGNYEKMLPTLERQVNFYSNSKERFNRYYSLWYYIALIETGNKEKGETFINKFSNAQEVNDWPTMIARFLNKQLSEKEFISASSHQDDKIDINQKCEAYFYIGMMNKYNNNPTRAREFFKKSVATGITDFVEYNLAKLELEKM